MSSYAPSAAFYDRLYAQKDYAGEVAGLLKELNQRGLSGGSCLDLACGTGRHLEHLQAVFDCDGLDLEPKFLSQGAGRVPGARLHQADMLDFSLAGRQFDLITCFFGSIGYLGEVAKLNRAIQHWTGYLKPGGILAIERWIDPAEFQAGRLFATFVDEPDFKLTRMVVSRAKGPLYDSDFHYLWATPQGVEHFVERHQLYMFSHDQYLQSMTGLEPELLPQLASRGMYLGVKPAGW